MEPFDRLTALSKAEGLSAPLLEHIRRLHGIQHARGTHLSAAMRGERT
jgi:hypothetical protein